MRCKTQAQSSKHQFDNYVYAYEQGIQFDYNLHELTGTVQWFYCQRTNSIFVVSLSFALPLCHCARKLCVYVVLNACNKIIRVGVWVFSYIKIN